MSPVNETNTSICSKSLRDISNLGDRNKRKMNIGQSSRDPQGFSITGGSRRDFMRALRVNLKHYRVPSGLSARSAAFNKRYLSTGK